MTATTAMAVPTLILIAGVFADLRSRRVPNSLVIALAIMGLGFSVFWHGWGPGLGHAFLGFGTALLVSWPLVTMGALGAGDMKLLAAFGLCAGWYAVAFTAIAAIVWGAILGLVRAALSGEGRAVLKNTIAILSRKKTEAMSLHHIPYTVALLFGWMTHLLVSGEWRPS